jgi:hypothetical protein
MLVDTQEYEIREIRFPNTAKDSEQNLYRIGFNCKSIEEYTENGEMAPILWFAIYKDDKKIAELRKSTCEVYYQPKIISPSISPA